MTQRLSDLGGHAYTSPQFPTSMAEIPAYMANLDALTAGLVLLGGCMAFLVWTGSARERASHRSRQLSGRAVTLPPKFSWRP